MFDITKYNYSHLFNNILIYRHTVYIFLNYFALYYFRFVRELLLKN